MRCFNCLKKRAEYEINWPQGEKSEICRDCKKKYLDPIQGVFPSYITINKIGEVPPEKIEMNKLKTRKKELENDLNQAIRDENYEKAAQIKKDLNNIGNQITDLEKQLK